MPDQKIYVGDIGTMIEINMEEDLTSWVANDFTFKVKKGDGTTTTWSNVSVKGPSGTDAQTLVYAVVDGDFNVDGEYFVTPYGNNGSWSGHGETIHFHVYALYE